MAIPLKEDLNGDTTTQGKFKTAIGQLWDWVNGKAEKDGDNTQTFKVADAVNTDEAVSKSQLDAQSAGIGVKLATDSLSVVKQDDTFIKNQCTAWVRFDGVDGTIKDSYNISSVTLVGTATEAYSFVFVNNMSTTNYGVLIGSQWDVSTNQGRFFVEKRDSITLNGFSITEVNSAFNGIAPTKDMFITVYVIGGK